MTTGLCRHPEQPQGGDGPRIHQGMAGQHGVAQPRSAERERGTDTRHQLDEVRCAQRRKPDTEATHTARAHSHETPGKQAESGRWYQGVAGVGGVEVGVRLALRVFFLR